MTLFDCFQERERSRRKREGVRGGGLQYRLVVVLPVLQLRVHQISRTPGTEPTRAPRSFVVAFAVHL